MPAPLFLGKNDLDNSDPSTPESTQTPFHSTSPNYQGQIQSPCLKAHPFNLFLSLAEVACCFSPSPTTVPQRFFPPLGLNSTLRVPSLRVHRAELSSALFPPPCNLRRSPPEPFLLAQFRSYIAHVNVHGGFRSLPLPFVASPNFICSVLCFLFAFVFFFLHYFFAPLGAPR